MSSISHLNRKRGRAIDDTVALYDFLDCEWMGVLSTVIDGEPWAVPMFYVRDGDSILIHGSVGAGALRHVADGAPAVMTIAVMDSLVVARTALNHSADYHSATIRGHFIPVPKEDREEAIWAFTDAFLPGRSTELPAIPAKDIAATTILRMPIVVDSWLMKARTHGFSEEDNYSPDDDSTWAGSIPVRTTMGDPVPAAGNHPSARTPASVLAAVAQRQ